MNEKPVPTNNSAEVDALPQNQDTTVQSRPQPIKKKKSRSHILLLLLALLVIAGLGGAATLLGYKYYFTQPASQSQSAPSQAVQKKLTAADTISLVRSSYTSELSKDTGLAVPIKAAGYNYYTGIDQSKVVAVNGTVAYTDSAVIVAKIAKILKEKGFTEKIVQSGADDSTYIADYTERDVVCEITTTKTYNNPTGDHKVDVACANMSDYLTTASSQKPFATVYSTKESETGAVQFVGKPTITASKTAGYSTAQLAIVSVTPDGNSGSGRASGLFYQTPDMKWHYFLSAMGLEFCNKYTTDDLKKAYVGTPCVDEAGKQITVTL
ncbi:hypothetical protein H7Y29_02275 [Microbacteriaceae bacterium]|nr:hypothetical protein [Candidatus Saccharibacteria bacterium]